MAQGDVIHSALLAFALCVPNTHREHSMTAFRGVHGSIYDGEYQHHALGTHTRLSEHD